MIWVCNVECREDPQEPFIVLAVSEQGARLAAIKTVQSYGEPGTISEEDVLAEYELACYELPLCNDQGDVP